MVHDIDPMTDLIVYMRFPFPVTPANTKWRWSKITDSCQTIKALTTVTGQKLTDDSVGDDPDGNAVVFIMANVDFSSEGQFYTELETTELPAAQAFFEPVRMHIISTATSLYYVTFAFNNAIVNFYHSATPGTAMDFQVPAQTLDPTNAQKITKQVKTIFNVKDTGGVGERIFFKIDPAADGWRFANDAEQTCEFKGQATGGFASTLTNYYCQFESGFEKTGIYFILKTGTFPANLWVQIALNVKNADYPS